MDNKNLILLVDDDRMNLKRAQEILQGDEYTIAATLSVDSDVWRTSDTCNELSLPPKNSGS